MFPIHSGIGGIVNEPKDLTQATISSALSMMAMIDRKNGITNNRRSMAVITTTANPRLCPNHASSFSRGEERLHDPEACCDEHANEKNCQGYAGNILGNRYILIRHWFLPLALSATNMELSIRE